jgi:eukaryotic-like serine/threonine-protein kinase
MLRKTEGIFQFGKFQIDPMARTLRGGKAPVTLNRRAFDVLLYFVQNPGRVLSRDELLKNVWSESFVDENSLAQSVSVLRRALEEKPGDNNYIVTLPGRGYQFVSTVQVIPPENENIGVEVSRSNRSNGLASHQGAIPASLIPEENEPVSQPTAPNPWLSKLVSVLSVAAIFVAGYFAWTRYHRVRPTTNAIDPAKPFPTARRSIAVLGFRNLSGRPEEAWLSTALTEMLGTELVAGEKLRLVSGEDIANTKVDLALTDAESLSPNTLARLHKNLDSDLIVLGSYTAVGNKGDTRIRLDLRLQDTVAGATIADVAVVGNETDLFDLVSQAGSRLREKLGVEAVSDVEAVSVRNSLPSNREAARLYSEGLSRLRVFDALAARDLLLRAVTADPKYPLAHSALAEAYSRLGYDRKAQQEARQAFDLAANLSREEKLVVEGHYLEVGHQYEKAVAVYRSLFALFPDNLDYGLKLAKVQVRSSEGHDALATVESLRKLATPASNDPRIDLQEADAWDALSDFKHQEEPLARAVEKARAQGARLLLARALENQCWLFSYFRQTQKAVAACRDSNDIYASAGDQQGEATALRAWGDAITQTDVLESIQLYQEAQILFRKNGSEGGVASVLNNLGLIYQVQGDIATAEKMHREALASYQLLDDKRHQAMVVLNIAEDQMGQGDLPGAQRLLENSLQLGREAEDTGTAAGVGYDIAIIRQLQGDLPGAKQGLEQSLSIWQKNGDQDSSAFAMWRLGSLLLQVADFSGARKMYEQALMIRTTAGDKLSIAQTQLGLAELSLEEGRSPVEQEALIRQTLDVFQKQKARDDETQAWCMLARALLAEGRAAEETDAMQHAWALSAKSQRLHVRWRTAIVAASLKNAEEGSALSSAGSATRKELAAVITKARGMHYQGVELDARLAVAEIEIKAGQITEGYAHLASIEADAKAKGYSLLARKAAHAMTDVHAVSGAGTDKP